MEPTNQAGAAATSAHRIALGQLEAFYRAEYGKLVKILVLLDASLDEAEDAAQKAMAMPPPKAIRARIGFFTLPIVADERHHIPQLRADAPVAPVSAVVARPARDAVPC